MMGESGNDDERKSHPQDIMVVLDPLAPSWSIDDFDVGRRLGQGQFGSVYLARERRTKYYIAIKAIKKEQLLQSSNEHLLRREIEIHSHMLHPNILQFFGWFCTPTRIMLMLEIAANGELMDKLSRGGLPEPTVAKYMFQMISAIRCCHVANVMHRDLKPENILIGNDDKLKLADFGWAAHFPPEDESETGSKTAGRCNQGDGGQNSGTAQSQSARKYGYMRHRRKTYCGTLDYLSPEICRHEWYGKEVDVWCLGILCYELATGGPPFSHDAYLDRGMAEEEARKRQQTDIQKSDIQDRLKTTMSRELKDFLTRALAKKPEQRMTTFEMICHPFIKMHNDITTEEQLEKQQKLLEGQQGITLLDGSTKGDKMGDSSNMPSDDSRTLFLPPRSPWVLSRHFLSAASSPHSGAVGIASPYNNIVGSASRQMETIFET